MATDVLEPDLRDAVVLALQEGRDARAVAGDFGLRREAVESILLDYETGHRHGGERDGAVPPPEVLASLIREAERLTAVAIPFLKMKGRLPDGRSLRGTSPLDWLTPAEGDSLRENLRWITGLGQQIVDVTPKPKRTEPDGPPDPIPPYGDNGEDRE